jgi:HSP20 family molecular chaperone IbpA
MRIRGNDPFFGMFEDFFATPVNYGRTLRNETNNNRNISENLPSTNVVETKGDYQYELLTPGFNRENIKIELDDTVLTIKFSRTFTVPEGIVLDEIYAKVENGITTLFLPKEKLGKTEKVNRNIEII